MDYFNIGLDLEDAYIMLVRAESHVWDNQSIPSRIRKQSCYILEQAIKKVGQELDRSNRKTEWIP